MRCAAALLLLAAPFLGGADRPRVTTVTPEYCAELSAMASERGAGHVAPASRLAREGRDLCASGHVRAGIHRLRQAIALLPPP